MLVAVANIGALFVKSNHSELDVHDAPDRQPLNSLGVFTL